MSTRSLLLINAAAIGLALASVAFSVTVLLSGGQEEPPVCGAPAGVVSVVPAGVPR